MIDLEARHLIIIRAASTPVSKALGIIISIVAYLLARYSLLYSKMIYFFIAYILCITNQLGTSRD